MIHKEGIPTIIITILLVDILITLTLFYSQNIFLEGGVIALSALLIIFMLHFFRNPKRKSTPDNHTIYAPADGKIVVIEETEANEYFQGKCLQISIFMSIWDAHINWIPVNGTIVYKKYHPGKYLIARNPKSSTLNERCSVVIKTPEGKEVLIRQIAGTVARRVVTYAEQKQEVEQNQQLGYIKFGSRVDLFLPIGTIPKVKLNEMVKGNKSIICNI